MFFVWNKLLSEWFWPMGLWFWWFLQSCKTVSLQLSRWGNIEELLGKPPDRMTARRTWLPPASRTGSSRKWGTHSGHTHIKGELLQIWYQNELEHLIYLYLSSCFSNRPAVHVNWSLNAGVATFSSEPYNTCGNLINVLANQIARPLNTRHHISKSGEWACRPITKLYVDYPFSVERWQHTKIPNAWALWNDTIKERQDLENIDSPNSVSILNLSWLLVWAV